jgi:hypothetical protein
MLEHLPLSITEIKNEWSRTSVPLRMPSWRGERETLLLHIKMFKVYSLSEKILRMRFWISSKNCTAVFYSALTAAAVNYIAKNAE